VSAGAVGVVEGVSVAAGAGEAAAGVSDAVGVTVTCGSSCFWSYMPAVTGSVPRAIRRTPTRTAKPDLWSLGCSTGPPGMTFGEAVEFTEYRSSGEDRGGRGRHLDAAAIGLKSAPVPGAHHRYGQFLEGDGQVQERAFPGNHGRAAV